MVVYHKSKGRLRMEQRIVVHFCLHFKEITVCLGRCGRLNMATSSLVFLSWIGKAYFPSPGIRPLAYFDQ